MRFADRLKQHRGHGPVASSPADEAVPIPAAPPRTPALPRLADRLSQALGLATPTTPGAAGSRPAQAGEGFVLRTGSHALGARVGLPAGVMLSLPGADQLRASLASLAGAAGTGPIATLDLETTGLGTVGGTAIPAVVGLAIADAQRVTVLQWVLGRGGAEGRMLDDVARRVGALADAGAVVITFNGASFDRPLLSGRLRRWDVPMRWPRHVDLLPAARRVWGHAQPDCRLPTLETHRLGVRRTGDVSGATVAEILADALGRGTGGRAVDAVVDHNHIDLLTPLCLLPRLHAAVQAPGSAAQARGVARHLVALGRPQEARARLEAQLRRCDRLVDPMTIELALECARLRRRAGDAIGAAALWAWVCASAPGHPVAHEGLAKHLEHRGRDPAAALAVAAASRRPCPHRLARLRRKAADRAIPALQVVVGRWTACGRAPASSAPAGPVPRGPV